MSTSKTKPPAGKVFRRLVSFIRPYRGVFAVGALLTIAGSLLSPLRPILFQRTIDHDVINGNAQGLAWMILLILALTLLQGLLSYYQTWVTNWIGENIINDMRLKVFSHIMKLRLRYFDKNPIGTLQTRTINDIQTLNSLFTDGIVVIIGSLLELVVIFAWMLYLDWQVTLVVMIVLPLLLGATRVFQLMVRKSFEQVRTYVGKLNAFLQEHITGMAVTQIFNREAEEYSRFVKLNQKHRNANMDSVLYYSIFFPVVELISALALALLVWYGAGSVLQGRMSFGVVVSFIMYINMFFRPIRQLADQFNTLQLGLVSADRLFKVLDTEEFISDKVDGADGKELAARPVDIRFEQVSFAYNETEFVLKDVSFDVPPGSTTAIVGATGAGKSSIINVLMRFYELSGGKILLNGVDAVDYRLKALREAMGLVLQDVFLFSGSIRDNITLNNPEIPLRRIQEAAILVGADEFIRQLPGGYDFHVGERGATLSAGQRQLLSFVRVLVYDPKILLLDEATANIDTETEELVQRAITKVLQGRTAIIIAHRLSTIQKADQILVMHKGELVERGTHQQLLRQEGFYKKLYLMQYGEKAAA